MNSVKFSVNYSTNYEINDMNCNYMIKIYLLNSAKIYVKLNIRFIFKFIKYKRKLFNNFIFLFIFLWFKMIILEN